jgi:hypothetical protein
MKTVKTYLLVLLMIIGCQLIHAQKFGVKAGLNFAKLSGSNNGDFTQRTGFYAGVFREISLVPKLFYLQPEIQYSSQGLKSRDILGNQTEYQIDYITVPVVAKLYLLKLFSLEGGAQFGFKINDNIGNDRSNGVNTFDPALVAGLSVNLPLGLSINGRYVQGFNEVIKDSDAKTQVIQIGASLKF